MGIYRGPQVPTPVLEGTLLRFDTDRIPECTHRF
jgi:hypothetical protein